MIVTGGWSSLAFGQGAAPVFSTSPVAQTVTEGTSPTFTAAASGGATYQWQLSMDGGADWAVLSDSAFASGVTSGSLVLSDVQTINSGAELRCVATNAAGQVASAAATLTVSGDEAQYGAPYTVTTLAGSVPAGPLDGVGTAATFIRPSRMYRDSSGTLYIVDQDCVRKMTTDQTVTTLAQVDVNGVLSDGNGNLYLVDTANNAIDKLASDGTLTTFAGVPGVSGYADGPGKTALFEVPMGIAIDQSGNLYVGDSANAAIRQIAPDGTVTTWAGGTLSGIFNSPQALVMDDYSRLYVGDGDQIKRVFQGNLALTVGGFMPGEVDGSAANARFVQPTGLATDYAANIYVVDQGGDTVRKVDVTGTVTTIAGTGEIAGSADGTGAGAQFNGPMAVVSDGSGNLVVADTGNAELRAVSSAGVVTTIAGSLPPAPHDGTGPAALFGSINGVAVDGSDNIYVTDNSGRLSKVQLDGTVTTLLTGLVSPQGVAVDAAGNVYFVNGYAIEMLTPQGALSVLAGGVNNFGESDGTGSQASFSAANGLAVDSGGNVYVADTYNSRIRMIAPGGVVTTIAGNYFGYADGYGAAALFAEPRSISVDGSGNLYVADDVNGLIRMISGHQVTTLAGKANALGYRDGQGGSAQFSYFSAVADSAGDLYIADSDGIRYLDTNGNVTTLAGMVTPGAGPQDGTGGAAQVFGLNAIARDSAGRLFVADAHRVRMAVAYVGPLITQQPAGQAAMAGQSVTFSAGASGGTGPLTYQWNFNGAAISGATQASLTLTDVQPASAGSYTVTASDGTTSVTSQAATLSVQAPGHLINVSMMGYSGAGAQNLSVGLTVGGSGTRTALIRGIGPSLAGFNVTGYMADPVLNLYQSGGSAPFAVNDNWGAEAPQEAALSAAFASTGAFALAGDSLDAAMLQTLAAGSYSARVTGNGGDTGTVLLEAYDTTPDDVTAQFTNMSGMGTVGYGANTLTVGFVIAGQTAETVLIRAVGPGLDQFGLSGVASTSLTLYDSGGNALQTNSGWDGSSQTAAVFSQVGAFALQPGSGDSALVVTLQPGRYSAIGTGPAGAQGQVLVELYRVPQGD